MLEDIELPRRTPQARFIPTCMGNSRRRGGPGPEGPVHPHMHGELEASIWIVRATRGSSPHAWGTHRRVLVIGPGVRFIPTCMGNSLLLIPGRMAPSTRVTAPGGKLSFTEKGYANTLITLPYHGSGAARARTKNRQDRLSGSSTRRAAWLQGGGAAPDLPHISPPRRNP